MTAFENKLRVWVSRHNAKSGEAWKVTVDGDNKIELFLPLGATTTKPVTVAPATPRKTTNAEVNAAIAKQKLTKPAAAVVAPVVVIEHPTREEFIGYLATIEPGQQFTLEPTYGHRFIEMVDWLLEIPGDTFEYAHNEIAKTLTIKKKGGKA